MGKRDRRGHRVTPRQAGRPLRPCFWLEQGRETGLRALPFLHSPSKTSSYFLDIASGHARRFTDISRKQKMSSRPSNPFVSDILPLTHCSGKIWREFSATAMIPKDRGGGG